MSTRTRDNTLHSLKLPDPFEDLTGLISSDLEGDRDGPGGASRQIGSCSRRGRRHQLRRKLWNNLTQAINETMESLTVERQ